MHLGPGTTPTGRRRPWQPVPSPVRQAAATGRRPLRIARSASAPPLPFFDRGRAGHRLRGAERAGRDSRAQPGPDSGHASAGRAWATGAVPVGGPGTGAGRGWATSRLGDSAEMRAWATRRAGASAIRPNGSGRMRAGRHRPRDVTCGRTAPCRAAVPVPRHGVALDRAVPATMAWVVGAGRSVRSGSCTPHNGGGPRALAKDMRSRGPRQVVQRAPRKEPRRLLNDPAALF